MHIKVRGPAYRLLRRLRAGVIAAKYGGLRSYAQVFRLAGDLARDRMSRGETGYLDWDGTASELVGF